MSEKKKNKTLLKKIRDNYRLAVFNEQTYEEVWRIRLSRLNVFTFIGTSAILLVGLVILLIAYTGLREYIPGYPDANQRNLMSRNASRVDSLIVEIDKRDRFFKSIKAVVSGDIPETIDTTSLENQNISSSIPTPKLAHAEEDIEIRKQVQEEEKFNLSILGGEKAKFLEQIYFFTPLKGTVSNHYNSSERHYGVDIVANPGETVSSILSGIVMFSGWTVETGYVIIIQHSNNLLSVYKHNSKLLKKVGDKLQAGEAIANVGNSGEYTSGPHLHFELWYNEIPLNPEEYISFE